MLETGSTVPDIALEDTTGRSVRLADYRGKDNVLLYFMRSTTCPVCNSHVKDLAEHAIELGNDNIRVLIAVPEGRAQAATWRAKRDLPFTVVTGKHGTPHESIGLMKKVFGAMQQSGSVLIDRNGIVRHAHAATMPISSYDKKGIASAIQELPVRG